jgi:hypothetical protein
MLFANPVASSVEAMTIGGFISCISGSSMILRNLSLDDCAMLGIGVQDSTTIEDTTVRSPAVGIWIQPMAVGDTVLRRVQVHSTAAQTVDGWEGIRIHPNPNAGTGNIVVEDSAILDPIADRFNSIGILIYPPSGYSVRVRRTRVETSRAVWLVTSDAQAIDFGTAGSPGANVLVSSLRCIEDVRPARPVADGLVATFAGTTLNGMSLPPSTVLTGPTISFPYYYIHESNNRVSF